MNLTEAEIVLNIYTSVSLLIFVLLSSSAKIREPILMSYFTKYLQRLAKFWHCRKK